MNFTGEQLKAISERGNTLVLAGAGSGKTRTLVERCAQVLLAEEPRVSVRNILVVTFNEAAAAEVRERLRLRLEQESSVRAAEQLAHLDLAQVSTLHSFCLTLLREHFYELDLDPAVSVLDDAQAQVLFLMTMDELLAEHYRGEHPFSGALKEFLQNRTRGWAKPLIDFVRKVHDFTQTRPDPKGWFERQFALLEEPECSRWQEWHESAVSAWRAEWLPWLRDLSQTNHKASESAALLEHPAPNIFAQVLELDKEWDGQKGRLRPPLDKFFDEAIFLQSLQGKHGDAKLPLQQDWEWAQGALKLLLQLSRQFAERFAAAKQERCALDFHDLEQGALRLLWDGDRPSAIAEQWRNRFAAVFVDEYQDINAAQDRIIRAVSAENRFLVGDNKQSIYRFRQADPAIFQRYLAEPHGWVTAYLAENFRSHEGILNFINPLFSWLMRPEVGGVDYDERAALRFAGTPERADWKCAPGKTAVELHLIHARVAAEEEGEDRSAAELEARHVAARLRALKEEAFEIATKDGCRAVRWGDMVVLLRAVSNKLEIYAKAFEAAGVPLHAKQNAFYTTQEVLDLFSLLNVLDNPMQDIPLVAVLRSPLCGMSAEDLAEVRMASEERSFWRALNAFHEQKSRSGAAQKVAKFLEQYHAWRDAHTSSSLSARLERILEDTGYDQWLLTQPRGAQRFANVQQLLRIARQFDQSRGESLYQFILHVQELQEAVGDIEPAVAAQENAVRLMTVHQSKGLEFPVVAVPDLGKPFNTLDQTSALLIDEEFGICGMIQPPGTGSQYPSLPLWLARRKQKVETLGEEIRLMYVAFTRAQNHLLLFGCAEEKVTEKWSSTAVARPLPRHLLRGRAWLDWLGAWITSAHPAWLAEDAGELAAFRYRIHRSAVSLDEAKRGPDASLTADLPELLRKVDWSYAHPEATREAAKTSVSALRRRSETPDEEASRVPLRRGKVDGRERGLACHTFIEHLELEFALDRAGLERQARRMVEEGILSPVEMASLNFDSLAHFWESEFGGELVGARRFLKRELPFTCKLTRGLLARHGFGDLIGAPAGEFVVVQGVVDLAVFALAEIWLLDFKTDDVHGKEVGKAAKEYRSQLGLYALALESIFERPVTRRGLYFVSARKLVWL